MITAILNSRKSDSSNNFTSLRGRNFNKLKSQQESAQISFTSLNFAKIQKGLAGDKSAKFGGKIRRFAEESAILIKGFLRKLKGKEELPLTEKPVTCDIYYDSKMKAELDQKAKEWIDVKARKAQTEADIKKAGHSVSNGDIDAKGYPTTSGQTKIDTKRKHHEDFTDNTDDKTSFKGKENVDSVDDVNKIDDINDVENQSLDVHDSLSKNPDLEAVNFNSVEKDINVDSLKIDHNLDSELSYNVDFNLDHNIDLEIEPPHVDIDIPDPTDLV